MKRAMSFFDGLLAGLAPPSPFEHSLLPPLEGTDLSRMRGDLERVGSTFNAVIERENGKAPTSHPTRRHRQAHAR